MIAVSATDVARALCRHLGLLGYEAVIVEPRAERVAAERRRRGDVARRGRPRPSARRRSSLTDHDAPYASQVLADAARSPGPVRRHDELTAARGRPPRGDPRDGRSATTSLGFASRSAWISAVATPEEIALSIAAGIVADANERAGGWMDPMSRDDVRAQPRAVGRPTARRTRSATPTS